MLHTGIGIGDLIQAAKAGYLQAAVEHIFPAGARVNTSRLSVVSGLTRKEISSLLKSPRLQSAPLSPANKEQRASRVLRGWVGDPRFCSRDGTPAPLQLRGSRRSFSLLVKLYAGDVTPNAVLKELQRMKAVHMLGSGELRVRSPRSRLRSKRSVVELVGLLANFADLVTQNIVDGEPPFFGFREFTAPSADQAARFHRIFSSRASALLEGAEQWRTTRQNIGQTSEKPGPRRVGIGIYLVQGSSNAEKLVKRGLTKSGGRIVA